jgi:hypothetical protein
MEYSTMPREQYKSSRMYASKPREYGKEINEHPGYGHRKGLLFEVNSSLN